MRIYTDIRLTRRVWKHLITDDQDVPDQWFDTLHEALAWLAMMGHQTVKLYPGPDYGPYDLDLSVLQASATIATTDQPPTP